MPIARCPKSTRRRSGVCHDDGCVAWHGQKDVALYNATRAPQSSAPPRRARRRQDAPKDVLEEGEDVEAELGDGRRQAAGLLLSPSWLRVPVQRRIALPPASKLDVLDAPDFLEEVVARPVVPERVWNHLEKLDAGRGGEVVQQQGELQRREIEEGFVVGVIFEPLLSCIVEVEIHGVRCVYLCRLRR